MIDINHSFHNGFFHRVLTEVPHHACALNIPICPTSTTMGSPGSFPGTLHCFRQFPGHLWKPTKAPQEGRFIVIGLYRDVWIAAIASSRTRLATLSGVMCNTSQCELRSLRVNAGMLNVIRIVTYYTLPPLESPTSS